MTPEQLLQHSDNGQLWPATQPPLTDLPAAYASALAVRALRQARGERPRGFKIGFTNRRIWPIYQVFAPIWGTVWDSTLVLCDDDQASLDLAGLSQPRIEPEAVFGFKATPQPVATGTAPGEAAQAIFDALDWVAPGFEIVQSHRPNWKFSAPDSVADGGLHARLVVGRRTPIADLAPDGPALHALLAQARLDLCRDGQQVEQGAGANVLDGPLLALAHFVAELRACPGAPDLVPGDVVTTGTWTDAWPVLPGQTWTAAFSAPLHALSVRF